MSWGYGTAPLQVGKILYRIRRLKGLSREDIAKMLDVSEKTVARWEDYGGVGNDPDIPLLNIMAQKFNVATDYLLEIDDPNFYRFSKAIRRRIDTFEVKTIEEAEAIKKQYRRATFPYESKCRILELEDSYLVEIISEYNKKSFDN